MNTTSTARGPSRSTTRRAAALLAFAFGFGVLVAAAPAQRDGGTDVASESVRITIDCEGPDREHILCVSP